MNGLSILVLGAGLVFGQESTRPKKIFVGGFGNAEGANELRGLVIQRLSKSPRVTVVRSSLDAEFILTAVGQISRQDHYP